MTHWFKQVMGLSDITDVTVVFGCKSQWALVNDRWVQQAPLRTVRVTDRDSSASHYGRNTAFAKDISREEACRKVCTILAKRGYVFEPELEGLAP
jgi:hypothetical protein